MADAPYWRTKTLEEMTRAEWEALCDGCARCCLIKLEDDDTGEIAYTDIACRLLDIGTCRCTRYRRRLRLVPQCVQLTPEEVRKIDWLPSTCAYRLVAEGRDLAWWHPLVSGDPETVHKAGISVRGRVVPERRGDDPEDRVVTWPE
ncbi:MAG: YcgN family cysteine cluster protein [Defluviicoccus sp.]|nr:YcgN family cysteine cluster protein [Defluviicoccus sp.]